MIEPVFRFEHLDEVDSTNRYCVDAARGGADEGLVVVADRQSAGRGRRGRSWFSPEGSAILASILFRPTFSLDESHVLSIIVGLSAVDAVQDLGGECSLKWPNDLVMGEKKVAGILAELAELQDSSCVVVGFGLNVAWPDGWPEKDPDLEIQALSATATSLERELQKPVDRDVLLSELISGVAKRYRLAATRSGRRSLLGEYRPKCSTIGQRVRVTLTSSSFEANALDIDDAGRLVVDRDAEHVVVEVGDVVHLRTSRSDSTD